MADDNEAKPTIGGKNQLLNLLVARKLEAEYHQTKYIAFIDLLGFSALVKQFPGRLNVEVKGDYEEVSTSTSKSAERFGRFHHILDTLANNYIDASHPERMMVFSDCAFLMYDNAPQAAVSLAWAMQHYLYWAIPVRMCIAKGTCQAERFSIESIGEFNITRSMFYGDGVVFATEGEKKGGKGCRIFLHRSLDGDDIRKITDRFPVVALVPPNEHSEYEMNYLHEDRENAPQSGPTGDQDCRLWLGLLALRVDLKAPVHSEVLRHYTDSFAAFNRMRQQRGRPAFDVPSFE